MTDKVQKIREEVERLQNELIQEKEKGFDSDADDACILELQNVLTYIDSLQKETVSDDLEKAARDYSDNLDNICGSIGEQVRNSFKAGAKWQKDQMIAKAIDAHCFGFQDAALFSFRLPAGNYLVGSEVKVIVIKEDCNDTKRGITQKRRCSNGDS